MKFVWFQSQQRESSIDRYSTRTYSVTNPKADHDTKGNRKLLHSNQGATRFRRRELGIVQRHDHAQTTNTETGDKPTTIDVIGTESACLDDDTDDKDTSGDDSADASTNSIGEVSVNKGSNPRSEFQNGRQHALLDTLSFRISICLLDLLASIRDKREAMLFSYGVNERLHRQNLSKHSLVIAIHQTSKRSE